MIELLLRGVVIGLGATILMDAWAILLVVIFGQSKPNWAPVGRWFWHLPKGTVFHEDIGKADAYRHELALGWAFHYAVGIVYGVFLALLAGLDWFAAPTFLPAWILGVLTVGTGWFLLQPGLGIGWAASRTPNPNRVRAMNLIAHTVFAAGLYGTALLLPAPAL